MCESRKSIHSSSKHHPKLVADLEKLNTAAALCQMPRSLTLLLVLLLIRCQMESNLEEIELIFELYQMEPLLLETSLARFR
jgi:hypothetical protein